MDSKLYIWCFALGIIGVLFHIFAVKAPAVKSRAEAANLPFSLSDYLRKDSLAIISSLITVIAAVLLVDEIIGYNPSLVRFIKFFFLFVGYTGSSLLITVLGKFDSYTKTVVDAKTNIADKK